MPATQHPVTARQCFFAAQRAAQEASKELSANYPTQVCVAGHSDYDALRDEILRTVAEFFPCEKITLSVELDKLRVPHFYYSGVLILRSRSAERGFNFL